MVLQCVCVVCCVWCVCVCVCVHVHMLGTMRDCYIEPYICIIKGFGALEMHLLLLSNMLRLTKELDQKRMWAAIRPAVIHGSSLHIQFCELLTINIWWNLRTLYLLASQVRLL